MLSMIVGPKASTVPKYNFFSFLFPKFAFLRGNDEKLTVYVTTNNNGKFLSTDEAER
jgi:hypothetical protein